MKLSYLQQGFGTRLPLVLLHPYPLNAYFWREQLASLNTDRHIIAPHFRGYGASAPINEGPFTVETFATDIRNTLTHLEIPHAVFAGCSMGGYILFELWRQAPDLVTGMILADTRAEADSEEARSKRLDTIERVRTIGTADLPKTAADMMFLNTHEKNLPLLADVKSWAAQPHPDVIIRSLEMLATRPDSRPTLGSITVSSLVIVGSDDKVTPPEAAQIIADGIRDSRLVIVPDAGHLSPLEQPEIVNSAINSFLNELEN